MSLNQVSRSSDGVLGNSIVRGALLGIVLGAICTAPIFIPIPLGGVLPPPWLILDMLLLAVLAVSYLVAFADAVVRLKGRRVLAVFSSAMAFGVSIAAVLALHKMLLVPPDDARINSVSSPSGAATAMNWQYDGSDVTGAIVTFRSRWPRTSQLLDAGTNNIAEFVWSDDEHLIVGRSPSISSRPASGPRRVDGIDVKYILYDADPDKSPPENVSKRELHDVSYGFEETDGPGNPDKQCIIHIVGIDGSIFDRVTVDVIGFGVGSPVDQYKGYGTVRVNFRVGKPVDTKSPPLTLTQAKFGSIFPKNVKPFPPHQNESSLYYSGYTKDEADQVFFILKEGDLNLKFRFGFDQNLVIYHVNKSITPQLISQFNTCSEKTNIYGVPFKVPVE